MGTASVTIQVDGQSQTISAEYADDSDTPDRVSDSPHGEVQRGLDALGLKIDRLSYRDQVVINPSAKISFIEHARAHRERGCWFWHCQVPAKDVRGEVPVSQYNWRGQVLRLLEDNRRTPLAGATLTPADLAQFRGRPDDPAAQFLFCLGTTHKASEFNQCVHDKLTALSQRFELSSGVVTQNLEDQWAREEPNAFPISLPTFGDDQSIVSSDDFDREIAPVLDRCPDPALRAKLKEIFSVYWSAIRHSGIPGWMNTNKILKDKTINEQAFRGNPVNSEQTRLSLDRFGFTNDILTWYYRNKVSSADTAHAVGVSVNFILLYNWARHGTPTGHREGN